MKRKLRVHIPDDPTEDNVCPVIDGLKYPGEITLEMMEAEVYGFPKHRSPFMLRALGRHLRSRFNGCVARIQYLPSQGRNGIIFITLNKSFADSRVPSIRIRLKMSWQVSPVFSSRFWLADRRAALRQMQKLRY